jgi:protease-4
MNTHDDPAEPPRPAADEPPAPAAPAAGAAGAAGAGRAAAGAAVEQVVHKLAQDLLRERRSERRWKVFFRLAWLGLALAVAWAVFVAGRLAAPPAGPHTALVEIRGAIQADGQNSADAIIVGLRAAFESPGVQAVVLRINSPGGSPVQAGIVHDEIDRLQAMHGKRVYAVIEEVGASGAYYVAAAADQIFVDKASLVGSIGVLMDGFGFAGTMEKLGIERRLLTAGENKGLLDPFSPVNPRHVAHAQALIDQVHRQFVNAVRAGRGERLRETPDMFSGLVWNGEQAVELGLADRTGSLDYVAREVVRAENIVDYTHRGTLAERLAERFGAGVGESAARTLRELVPQLR